MVPFVRQTAERIGKVNISDVLRNFRRRNPVVKYTELGEEIQCVDCGDMYPRDDEFFHANGRGGLRRTCRACDCEKRAA